MKKILSMLSLIAIMISIVCIPTFAKEYSVKDVYTVDIPSELIYDPLLENSIGYDDVKAWSTSPEDEDFLTAFIFTQNLSLGIDIGNASDDEIDALMKKIVSDISDGDFKCDTSYEKEIHKEKNILKISMRNIDTGDSYKLHGDVYLFTSKAKTCMVYFLSLDTAVLNGEYVAHIMDSFEFKVNFFEEYSTYIYIGIGVIVLLILLSIIKSISKKTQQVAITQYEMPANFKSYTDDGSAPVSFDDFAQTDYESDMKAQFSQYSQPQNNDDGLSSLSAENMDSSLLAKKEEIDYSEYTDSDSLSVSNLDTSSLVKKEDEKSSWLGS